MRASTIQQRFEAFHQANPWIYRVLVQMIQELRDHGVTRFGVRSLWEVLRWKITIEVEGVSMNYAVEQASTRVHLDSYDGETIVMSFWIVGDRQPNEEAKRSAKEPEKKKRWERQYERLLESLYPDEEKLP
jgi:hypothetical protein